MNKQFGRKTNGMPKYLTNEELTAFMAEAKKNPKLDLLFSLILAFGLRESEAVEIQLSDITENQRIHIRAKKKGWAMDYDLSPKLWRKYRRWMRARKELHGPNPYLFPSLLYSGRPSTSSLVIEGFRRIAERIGLVGRAPHSLRHTCAILQVRKGFNAAQTSRHLRHKTIASSWPYFQVVEDAEHERKAQETFDQFL